MFEQWKVGPSSRHIKTQSANDDQNGSREINTKKYFFSSFLNLGLEITFKIVHLGFICYSVEEQSTHSSLFSLIDDLVSAWRVHMSMAGGSMLLVKTAFAWVTLKRRIQARLEVWEFIKKRALTEQVNNLELKQLLPVFAHGKKKVVIYFRVL